MTDLKVLYVEDDHVLRYSVNKYLKKIIPNISVASDAYEGIEKYMELKPNVVVTDLEMPGMTGLELVKEIKKIDADVQFIITTAFSADAELIKHEKYVLLKPYSLEDLNLLIKSIAL